MTILVTGAAGVVGSALLAELKAEDVVALAHLKAVPGAALHGDVTRPWLGLHPRDYRELAASVDVVVHCAGSVDFGASARTLHRLNVVGTGHVLRLVADADARLVHVSTAFIARVLADDAGGGRIALAVYADSKARSEALVRGSGLPATIARVSTVIGDSGSGQLARVQAFHAILAASMSGMVPFLPSTPETLVDLLPQDVVAQALAALATHDTAGCDHWVTAGSAALPMATIIDTAFEAGARQMHQDPHLPNVYAPAFKTRLLAPETFANVMTMLYSHAEPGADSDQGALIERLMATYDGSDLLPTSLGEIEGGPPVPTRDSVVRALSATCRRLAEQPGALARRATRSRRAGDRFGVG